jgi:hypothetical protein
VERRGVYRVLVGKPGGKSSLGRPGRRWENNIKMDFQEVLCGGMDWIELAVNGNDELVLLMEILCSGMVGTYILTVCSTVVLELCI